MSNLEISDESLQTNHVLLVAVTALRYQCLLAAVYVLRVYFDVLVPFPCSLLVASASSCALRFRCILQHTTTHTHTPYLKWPYIIKAINIIYKTGGVCVGGGLY